MLLALFACYAVARRLLHHVRLRFCRLVDVIGLYSYGLCRIGRPHDFLEHYNGQGSTSCGLASSERVYDCRRPSILRLEQVSLYLISIYYSINHLLGGNLSAHLNKVLAFVNTYIDIRDD